MSKHLVFGAGLIGCYLGGSLAHKKQNVTLLARQQIMDKLAQGIVLTDYLQHKVTIENLAFLLSHEASAQDFDVIWLTVKCTGVAGALAQLQSVVQPQTTIICCQNGLGSENIIKQTFPNNRVLRAMVPFNVVVLGDAHYHRGSEGMLTIEDSSDDEQFTEQLVACIDSPILPVTRRNQMTELLWAKLQLNLGNSVNALADIPVKSMLQQRKYRLVIAQMMRELLLVTDAKGIVLPKVTSVAAKYLPLVLSLPDGIFKILANKMLAIDENVRTSMWWDIANGKQTEIDYLNGVIVEQGASLGIDTPVNKKVIGLVKGLTNHQATNRKSFSAEDLYNLVGKHE
ncbi:2-dehydropantoate 2-reductase [Aliiglaciecola sp. 3_MG-2023]|uniref:2-dehydropantoate 2-reductase n=1 Tax=Aliiglaciecola sp. 3_MG-2023 TaxID=3062644 RepID=UPI0026E172CB|nr:2-dehydropantoate 2-reductase [Aliiglaciecola sp. 3_MG-2023]MDO6693382.1 2-dehydropantoate 2-reductase [Aliiglaciecola sp. 3_MG-2023]